MYKTKNGWTKEKIFEHVLSNFLGKSVNKMGGKCVYRGPNGKKCAVGMFIPDEKYDSRMDKGALTNDTSAINILRKFEYLQEYMPLDIPGMVVFQRNHDCAVNDVDCLNNMLDFIEKQVED
jgi:hypothetical protein